MMLMMISMMTIMMNLMTVMTDHDKKDNEMLVIFCVCVFMSHYKKRTLTWYTLRKIIL